MFIDVGFQNYINAHKVVGICRPDSSPIRRLIKKAEEEGRYVNITQGKKTRSIIVHMDDGELMLIGTSAKTDTIARRFNNSLKDIKSNAEKLEQFEVVGEGSSS